MQKLKGNFTTILNKIITDTSPDKILGLTIVAKEFYEILDYRWCGGYSQLGNGSVSYTID